MLRRTSWLKEPFCFIEFPQMLFFAELFVFTAPVLCHDFGPLGPSVHECGRCRGASHAAAAIRAQVEATGFAGGTSHGSRVPASGQGGNPPMGGSWDSNPGLRLTSPASYSSRDTRSVPFHRANQTTAEMRMLQEVRHVNLVSSMLGLSAA